MPNVRQKSLQYPKFSPFLYENDERIYNVSRLDLHFWFRMVSKLLGILLYT